MSSWLHRLRGEIVEPTEKSGNQESQPERSRAKPRPRPREPPQPKDPNAPVRRLQLHQKCLYERTLPGDAFVSAHVNRLQHGYYQSKALHEGPLNHVYFVSVHFVFHPKDHHYHRIRAATIKVSVHGELNPDTDIDVEKGWYKPSRSSPRILKHAPELIYGAVSPENLQWNFNLSSSLGVSQMPVSASINPSGGVRKSYRLYDMMSMQGSLRVLKSPLGSAFDVDDAMAVWTLEENLTQRSGLPREFDFVMLVHKPDDVRKVYLTVDLDASISSRFGDYPEWYTNLSKYMPNIDAELDMDTEIGQKFLPEKAGRGFNFADLPHSLDQYVCMPGNMFPTVDRPQDGTISSGDQNWGGFQGSNPAGGSGSGGGQNWQQYQSYEPVPGSGYGGQTFQRYRQYETTTKSSSNDYRVSAAVPTASPEQMSPTQQVSVWGQQSASIQAPAPQRQFILPETLNVRVTLEHSTARSPNPNRYSTGSPITPQDPSRRHSIRRRRSRSELKEYGVQQALSALAGDTLKEPKEKENDGTPSRGARIAKPKVAETMVNGRA